MNQIIARSAFGGESAVAGDSGPSPQEIFDQAAALIPIGAFSCDLATEQLAWTAGVFDIFGLSGQHALDRRETVKFYCEESRERLEQKRSQAIAMLSGFSMDANIVRPDGATRRIRITASTRGSNGRATTLYGMKQDITEDHIRWEILRSQAECDPLTGVANRSLFQKFLDRQSGAPVLDAMGALILFDMDGFKQVNDLWGHAAGDACLVAFGKRLRKAFPQASLISRIGGDEFAVLLPGMGSRMEAEAAVSSLIGNVLRPVPWDGHILPISASVGLAFVSAGTELEPEKLFVAADKALYEAKRSASTILVCA